MRIVTGASSLDTVVERIKAGAEEIFVGYISEEWVEKYGYFISPNRRWGKIANFMSLSRLKSAVKIAKDNNVRISLAVNAHTYNDSQMCLLKRMIAEIVEIGIDILIIADLGVMIYVLEHYPQIEVHVSTGGTVFNKETVKFYRNLGVKRVIFPRSLNPNDIIKIASIFPEMEFEVFMNGARCANIDGFCFFEHSIMYLANSKIDNYPMCGLDYDFSLKSNIDINEEEEKELINKFKCSRKFNVHPKACGACELYKFNKGNIKFVKIPARASKSLDNRSQANNEIKFIKVLIDSLNNFNNENEYRKFAKEKFQEYFNMSCDENSENCYY